MTIRSAAENPARPGGIPRTVAYCLACQKTSYGIVASPSSTTLYRVSKCTLSPLTQGKTRLAEHVLSTTTGPR